MCVVGGACAYEGVDMGVCTSMGGVCVCVCVGMCMLCVPGVCAMCMCGVCGVHGWCGLIHMCWVVRLLCVEDWGRQAGRQPGTHHSDLLCLGRVQGQGVQSGSPSPTPHRDNPNSSGIRLWC